MPNKLPRTPKTKRAPRVDVNLALSLADKELRTLRKHLRQKHLMELVTHADYALEHLRAGRAAHNTAMRAINSRVTRIDHKLTGVEHTARFMANARKRGGK